MLDVTRLHPEQKPMAIYHDAKGKLWVTLQVGPRQLEEVRVGTKKDVAALHRFYHIDYHPRSFWGRVQDAFGITAWLKWRGRVRGQRIAARMLARERKIRGHAKEFYGK